MVLLLPEHGADINAQSINFLKPLDLARIHNRTEIVDILEEREKNPQTFLKQNTEETALHLATLINKRAIVKKLLEEGADINARNKYGFTPLHYAAERNLTKLASFLINQGANINARNSNNETPLHYASLNGNDKLVALLIAKGADSTIKTRNGISPLDIAMHNDNEKVRSIIIDSLLEKPTFIEQDLLLENNNTEVDSLFEVDNT